MTEIISAAVLGCRARGLAHARQLSCLPGVALRAVADLVDDRRAQALDLLAPGPRAYADFKEMLQHEQPELVAITTASTYRLEPIQACVDAGVRLIQCEKPMAPSLQEARAIHELCRRHGVLLSFCHQRRFAPHFRHARQLIEQGALGSLHYLQGFTPNYFDWGTHWLDMFFAFNNEQSAVSVLAQFDRSEVHYAFQQPNEHGSVCSILYANGVRACLTTDQALTHPDIMIRAIGSHGILEVGPRDEPRLRFLNSQQEGWQIPVCKADDLRLDDTGRALQALLQWRGDGTEPEHSSRRALATTELLFAGMASCLQGGRVDLPFADRDLEIDVQACMVQQP